MPADYNLVAPGADANVQGSIPAPAGELSWDRARRMVAKVEWHRGAAVLSGGLHRHEHDGWPRRSGAILQLSRLPRRRALQGVGLSSTRFHPIGGGTSRRQRRTRSMVHGRNRIPYRIDLRLSGLAGTDYNATTSFGLPFEPEDSQYGKSWSRAGPVSLDTLA